MKRLQRRAEWRVTHNPSEKRVLLRLGMDVWSLTTGEATDLADRLVDHAEQLQEKP